MGLAFTRSRVLCYYQRNNTETKCTLVASVSKAITMARATISLIIFAACATAALSCLLLSIWLYRRQRHTRQPHLSTSTRGDYNEVQKRNRPQFSHPDVKNLSASTISISIPDHEKQNFADLEAQPTEYHSQTLPPWQSQIPTQLCRNTSISSTSSYYPEPLSEKSEPFNNPHLFYPHISRPEPSVSSLKVDSPTRNISTRVPNFHTDAEYSILINEEVDALMRSEPLPPLPPTLSKTSTRRASDPTSVDCYLAASTRLEAGMHMGAPQNSRRTRSLESQKGRLG